MYRIERTQRLKDELELVDGAKRIVIEVDIDIDSALDRYIKAQNNIVRIKTRYTGTEQDNIDFAEAVLELFEVFFGEPAVLEILEFYDGHHAEMLEAVYPYIMHEVYPKLKRASKDKRRRLIEQRRNARRGRW